MNSTASRAQPRQARSRFTVDMVLEATERLLSQAEPRKKQSIFNRLPRNSASRQRARAVSSRLKETRQRKTAFSFAPPTNCSYFSCHSQAGQSSLIALA